MVAVVASLGVLATVAALAPPSPSATVAVLAWLGALATVVARRGQWAAVAVALLLGAPAGALASGDPEPVEDAGEGPGSSELDPDPGAIEPELDPTEPVDGPSLPPDGLAKRPALPAVQRDLIAPRQPMAGRGGASVDLAKIGEDLFLDLNFVYVFRPGDWRIAPRLPLRIRIVDRPPKSSSLIRQEDWNELSDFARLLAFVQYGAATDPIFFRYGELHGVTVGHGSLVNRYFNTIDIDRYKGGVYALVDLDIAGGEVMLDNVLRPEILVGRSFVRPFSFFESWPDPLQWMKFGVTLGADFRAPLAIAEEEGGRIFTNPEWRPEVLASQVAGLFGLDLEVPVVSSPHIDVVPYMDFATIQGRGAGFHLGTYLTARFNPRVTLRTRVEYRFQGKRYEAGYISPFYEIERYSHQGGDPKLARLRRGEIGHTHNGFYFEGDFRYRNLVRYTLIYATFGGERGHDLMMRLRLDQLGPFRLTLLFGRLGFEGFDNLFAADRTLWGISLRWLVTDYFYVRGRVLTEWWLRHTDAETTGFETTVNFSFGAGIIIRL